MLRPSPNAIPLRYRFLAMLLFLLAAPARPIHAQSCGQVTGLSLSPTEITQGADDVQDAGVSGSVTVSNCYPNFVAVRVEETIGDFASGPSEFDSHFIGGINPFQSGQTFVFSIVPPPQPVTVPTIISIRVFSEADSPGNSFVFTPTGFEAVATFILKPLNPTLTITPSQIVAGSGQTATATVTFDKPPLASFSLTADPVSTGANGAIAISPCSTFCPVIQGSGTTTFQFTISTTRSNIPTTDLTLRLQWGLNEFGLQPVPGLTRTATLRILQQQSQLHAGALFSDLPGPIAPQVVVSTDASAPTIAHLPLGRAVTFAAFDDQGQPATGAFSLSSQNVTQAGLDSDALFHDFTAFQYATNPAPSQAVFQPVHLGTVLLTIAPADSSLPTGYIRLVVENPASLGSAHGEVDALLYPIAQRTGIPPQYLKGQIRQESGGNFNPLAYRYEPLQGDVGDYGKISRGPDYRRDRDPYFHYRLATQADCLDNALPGGDGLLPADIGSRSQYQICLPGTACRPIDPADQFVTAWDIIQSNPRANWQTVNYANYLRVQAAFRANNTCGYLWTAQTGLAASYGYLQMTYVTANDTLHWPGTSNGAKNPSSLYDSPENLAAGGGSVNLAGTYIKNLLQEIHGPDVTAPQFNAISDLQDVFEDGWAYYNGINGADPYGYAASVLSFSGSYMPSPSHALLGGN